MFGKWLSKSNSSSVSHWKIQRLLGLFLIAPFLWVSWTIPSALMSGYAGGIEYLESGINKLALWGLIVVGLMHAKYGVESISDDYVSNEQRRIVFLYIVKVVFVLAAIMATYLLLSI